MEKEIIHAQRQAASYSLYSRLLIEDYKSFAPRWITNAAISNAELAAFYYKRARRLMGIDNASAT